jgi:hypothetical protein
MPFDTRLLANKLENPDVDKKFDDVIIERPFIVELAGPVYSKCEAVQTPMQDN